MVCLRHWTVLDLCGHVVSPRAVVRKHMNADQSSLAPKFGWKRCAAPVAEKCGNGVIISNCAINYISIPCCFLFPVSHDRDFDY